MSIELIETLSKTLTDHDLTDAIGILIEERKSRHSGQLLRMKQSLIVGDAVQFYHSARSKYIQGTVKRVKKKKAIIWEDGHGGAGPAQTWDVPMGMLKKVSELNE